LVKTNGKVQPTAKNTKVPIVLPLLRRLKFTVEQAKVKEFGLFPEYQFLVFTVCFS